MNILNLLSASQAITIICYVVDIILILGAIALFVWYYVKSAKAQTRTPEQEKEQLEKTAEKIDDDTYVLKETPVVEPQQPQKQEPKDNLVEHFSNQISEISGEQSNALKSKTVIVNHKVEKSAPKTTVKKEDVSGVVVVGGVNKAKADPKKAQNVGVNAYKDSTNFFNTIKDATVEPAKAAKTTSASKTTSTTKKAATTKSTTRKTTSKK